MLATTFDESRNKDLMKKGTKKKKHTPRKKRKVGESMLQANKRYKRGREQYLKRKKIKGLKKT